jgi:hypothetical protein
LATEQPVVSGLGGDGEDNYGYGLTMAAKMVMERWTNYGGGDGDGANNNEETRLQSTHVSGTCFQQLNTRNQ